jgi:hypothetical protein
LRGLCGSLGIGRLQLRVDFLPQDGYISGRLNAQFHSISLNCQDRYGDRVAK